LFAGVFRRAFHAIVLTAIDQAAAKITERHRNIATTKNNSARDAELKVASGFEADPFGVDIGLILQRLLISTDDFTGCAEEVVTGQLSDEKVDPSRPEDL